MAKYPPHLDTRKLEAVEYDAKARELRVRFDDGCLAAVSATTFKEFPNLPVTEVRLGRPAHWVEFHFADGSMHDVAGDYITWLTNPEYAAAYPEDHELGPRIGANVVRLRKVRDLSQGQLAKAADLQAPNLSRLEAGKHIPTLDVLLRIAKALGVTLSALMTSPAPEAAKPARRPAKRAPTSRVKPARSSVR